MRDIVEFELFVSSQLLLFVELVATILCSANTQYAVREYLDSYKVINPKYYKHLAYALAATLDYKCLAYFEPESKVYSQNGQFSHFYIKQILSIDPKLHRNSWLTKKLTKIPQK